jgi:hypothetical protein
LLGQRLDEPTNFLLPSLVALLGLHIAALSPAFSEESLMQQYPEAEESQEQSEFQTYQQQFGSPFGPQYDAWGNPMQQNPFQYYNPPNPYYPYPPIQQQFHGYAPNSNAQQPTYASSFPNQSFSDPSNDVTPQDQSSSASSYIPTRMKEGAATFILKDGGYFIVKVPSTNRSYSQQEIISLPPGKSYIIFAVPSEEEARSQASRLGHVTGQVEPTYQQMIPPYPMPR